MHACFRDLPEFLQAGDVLVVNTSATINAAVMAWRPDGSLVEAHFSTRLPSGQWLVELRQPAENGTEPLFTAQTGESLVLAGHARLRLAAPYRSGAGPAGSGSGVRVRLWYAEFHSHLPVERYLEHYGFPIRYKHVRGEWPLSDYQTVYADEPGSAEMPSAGRAFTRRILDRLEAKGVRVARLVLHTGVASLESHEPPHEEYYRVPEETARLVNLAHAEGRRVIAVGTTVIRALETAAAPDGTVHAGEGWTGLLITPFPSNISKERGHPAARAARRRRPADRVPRPALDPPADARGAGPPGRSAAGLRRGAARALPVARIRRPAPDLAGKNGTTETSGREKPEITDKEKYGKTAVLLFRSDQPAGRSSGTRWRSAPNVTTPPASPILKYKNRGGEKS